MNTDRHIPVVFVSSTCYDLKQVREDLKDFFEINYGFQAMLSEFSSFPIDPCIGTFENCLSNVDKLADIFILIVGTRYGYVTEREIYYEFRISTSKSERDSRICVFGQAVT